MLRKYFSISENFAKRETFDNQVFMKIASCILSKKDIYFVIFLKKKPKKYAGLKKTLIFTSPKLRTAYFEPFGNLWYAAC
jgi:hypothetical protein